MKGNIHLGEGELTVMQAIWQAGKPVTSVDIGRMVEERGWKKTTIATFLTRLTEKGALQAEKQGKLYYYTPCITKEEYRRAQTHSLITRLYQGSAREFAVALFGEGQLRPEELEKLEKLLEEGE